MLDPEHPPGDPHDGAPADGHHPEVSRFLTEVRAALAIPQASRRLSLAGVRARIDVTDAAVAVWLLLDRFPPEVVTGTVQGRPTVRLALSAADLGTMLAEGSHLPMAILSGDVVFEGSVRKLLRVLPILRSAAEEARWAAEDEQG